MAIRKAIVPEILPSSATYFKEMLYVSSFCLYKVRYIIMFVMMSDDMRNTMPELQSVIINIFGVINRYQELGSPHKYTITLMVFYLQ